MAPSTLARAVLLAFVIATAVAPGAAFGQTAVDDEFELIEDDQGFISVLINDDQATEITDVADPPKGTAVESNVGVGIIYTPDPNYFNYCNNSQTEPVDEFEYEIDNTDTATVSVTVTCVDDKPVAVDDSFGPAAVDEDSGPADYPVLANDSDIDGPALQIASITNPNDGGTASIVQPSLNLISYRPKPNYCGTENLTYTLVGGVGLSGSGDLSVDVLCKPDLPVANDDTRTLALNTGTAFIDVLSNDFDADNVYLIPSEAQPIPILALTQPGNGSARIVQGTGDVPVDKIAYTPKAGTCGTDSFTYTVNGDDTATVTITVSCATPVPKPTPTASASARAGKLKVSGTTLKVPLRCGKAAKCAVSLRLTSKKTVLGKAKATLKAGQKKTVKLKLNKAGKRKLKKSRRLKAKLKITLGGKTVVTRTVTFKAKRKKR